MGLEEVMETNERLQILAISSNMKLLVDEGTALAKCGESGVRQTNFTPSQGALICHRRILQPCLSRLTSRLGTALAVQDSHHTSHNFAQEYLHFTHIGTLSDLAYPHELQPSNAQSHSPCSMGYRAQNPTGAPMNPGT